VEKTLLGGQHAHGWLGLPLSLLPAWGTVGPTTAGKCNWGVLGMDPTAAQPGLSQETGDREVLWGPGRRGHRAYLCAGREPVNAKQYQGIPCALGAPSARLGWEGAYSGPLPLRVALFVHCTWVPAGGGVQGFAAIPSTFSDA